MTYLRAESRGPHPSASFDKNTLISTYYIESGMTYQNLKFLADLDLELIQQAKLWQCNDLNVNLQVTCSVKGFLLKINYLYLSILYDL